MARTERTRILNNADENSSAAEVVRRTVEEGEGYFRQQDFPKLPAGAVSQALSRLTRLGILERVSKGLYYRPRKTAFGKSHASASAIRQLPIARKSVFPSGVTAANLLGFTTQTSARGEFATAATSFPRAIVGKDVRLHTRRPEAWNELSEMDAALLDFLRQRGASSELSPKKTIQKLSVYLREDGRFKRLTAIALLAEPPRVRAILGAIGQEIKEDPKLLQALRSSINTLSRFDFGLLSDLRFARDWGAKEVTNERRQKGERA